MNIVAGIVCAIIQGFITEKPTSGFFFYYSNEFITSAVMIITI